MYRVIELLIVASHIKNVTPRPRYPLQHIAVLRTFVRNDKVVLNHKSESYGGVSVLHQRMFADMALHSNDDVNFLPNSNNVIRHLSSMLRESMHLINTDITDAPPFMGSKKSSLEFLLYLDNEKAMPDFSVSHIGNVACLRKEVLAKKMIEVVKDFMENGRISEPIFTRNYFDSVVASRKKSEVGTTRKIQWPTLRAVEELDHLQRRRIRMDRLALRITSLTARTS